MPVAHISCLSHTYHRLVADQLFSGYLSCLSHRSVLVAHLLYPYLPYVAVIMSFGSISLKSSNPFETVKLTWQEDIPLDLKTWRHRGPGSSTGTSRRTKQTVPSHCPYAAEAIIIPPFRQFIGTNGMRWTAH